MALVFFGLLSSMALCAAAEWLSSIAELHFFCLGAGENRSWRLVFPRIAVVDGVVRDCRVVVQHSRS